jgi:hypothetical protein
MMWQTVKGDTDHTQQDPNSQYGRLVRIAQTKSGRSDAGAAKIISGIES